MQLDDSQVDLGALSLSSGAGAVLNLELPSPTFTLGGYDHRCREESLAVRVDASRTVGDGWAFRIKFQAHVIGPCTRCLGEGGVEVPVETREASRPGGGEELESPYLTDDVLDVESWMRDSLLLATPTAILCDPTCKGLCPECGERLADLPDDHEHERPPDPRWDALRRLSD